ncbi:MAG: hypothetical protein OEY11_14240 [Gammaproteobacteria bacterium]|nr:hypothetical protein [Gammaproteobacteria bacterium]
MSLLLEALKKAAEDKEKSSLAMQAETRDADSQAPTAVADIQVPEVNEELLLQAKAESETESLATESASLDEELELYLPDVEMAEPAPAEAAEPANTASIQKETLSPVVSPSQPETQYKDANNDSLNSKATSATIGETHAKDNGLQLPPYNPSDARKVLAVSQSRYHNTQRMMYYGMYVFAALLFFVASYLYYSAEILDNSQKPVFKPAYAAPNQQKTLARNEHARYAEPAAPVVSKITQPEQKKRTAKAASATKTATTAPLKARKKISIVKQQKPDPVSALLNKAYAHYQSAEYQQADDIYRKVLARDHKQYDALLGRAAVAVVAGNMMLGRQFYKQTLYFYPDDSIARAALVDLTKKAISVADESQLNLLLRDNPEAAHVYFSLGLLYEKQGRINESQQAFFNAFALEKKADYAFNLAIMLEKLGQSKAALSYYKKASALADNSVNHFNEKSVLERIEQLENINE